MPSITGRTDYTQGTLLEAELDPDPIRQFQRWFSEAAEAGQVEPNAMTLATASPEGRPSARIVLLRQVDPRGFSFFTSYQGRKSLEIEANPHAALVFFWALQERQVRVEGVVERVSTQESDDYYASRPRGSKLGAWCSPQSSVVASRSDFENLLSELESQYPGDEIPRPPFWGGFRVVPESIEFWQGRPSRLHDRLRYRKLSDGRWKVDRLAP